MEATIVKTKEGLNGKGGVVGTLALFKCNICKINWWDSFSKNRRFCSRKCYSEHQKTLPSNNNKPEIGRKISKTKGDKTGWVTSKNALIRSSKEYKEWRTKVFKRDDYTCQICEERGGVLNADHIEPFATHIEKRLDVSNGRTLCLDCHKKTDNYLVNTSRDNKTGRFIKQYIEKFLK